MTMNSKIKIKLQGHEKFPLREGWLNKGLMVVEHNPKVFQGKEAPDVLGIGSNMVKSLRYWLKAFKLVEDSSSGTMLTTLGKIINEKDPYIEDKFTLWLLHSQIAKNIEDATTWYMFFNRCDIVEMEKEKIQNILYREISKYVMGQTFSEKSLKNDVDVLLSMYGRNRETVDPEDKSISPFAGLKLVKNTGGQYTKVCPDRRDISEWNVLYELSVMMEDKDEISIDQAINGECGLECIYQIKPVLANELLDKLDAMDYIRVDRTAGLDMIYRSKDFTPVSVMADYYGK